MVLWIPLVNAVFPDARHIHIIRMGARSSLDPV
jgi:hypothetical protein